MGIFRWPAFYWGSKARELEKFAKERENIPKFEPPKRISKLWSMLEGMGETKIARYNNLIRSSELLRETLGSPGWSEILDCRNYYIRQYDAVTKNPLIDDRDRFKAACEYASIMGFFAEIANRIKKGTEAKDQLKLHTEQLRKKRSGLAYDKF